MTLAESLLAVFQQGLAEFDRLAVPPGVVACSGHIPAGPEGIRMRGTAIPVAVRQHALIERNRLPGPASGAVNRSQAGPGPEGVRRVGAGHAPPFGESALEGSGRVVGAPG